jgi:hypothetical protein
MVIPVAVLRKCRRRGATVTIFSQKRILLSGVECRYG